MKSQQISLGGGGQAIVIRENVFNEFGVATESVSGILNIQKEKAETALLHVKDHAWKISPARNGQPFGDVKMLRPLTDEEKALTEETVSSRGNLGYSIQFDETFEGEEESDEVVQTTTARANA